LVKGPWRPLPGGIFLRQADGTGSVARGDGRGLIEKKHPVLNITATVDSLEGRATVETAVNPTAAMAAQ